MPTYEYICSKCGHEFETIQSISAGPLKICPQDACAQKKWGHGSVKRKISAGAGLLFKGSGFYITDYRSEGYKKSAKTESTKSAKTESTAAKPAATDAKKPAATPAKGESAKS
jgi:putative FmdB family regulatory protein